MRVDNGPWRWPRGLTEALTLSLLCSLLCGFVLGGASGWSLFARGFVFPAVVAANRIVWTSLLVALGFFVLFLPVLARLHRRGRSLPRSCFVASAFACVPLFLVWGRIIDRANGIHRANLFDRSSLLFHLEVGLGFLALWIALSLVLVGWVRARVLSPDPPRLLGPALLAAATASLGLAVHVPWTAPRTPNVIVLLIDCLRADHLSCYGYERETSPHLDRFAADAIRFSNTISQSTYTKTSVASLFTSKNPSRHGVYYGSNRDTAENIVSDVLGDEQTTLAEVLLENGLLTGAWLHQGQLRDYMGFAQGFVVFDNRKGTIDEIDARFTAWQARLGGRTPFFAYLHYLDLHDPYRPMGPYATMYGAFSDIYARVDFDHVSWGTFHHEVRDGTRVITPADVEQLKSYYDGIVTSMDASIGRLFDELKRTGAYDDSLIIVTADHGDGFMEHGFLAHSAAPYEELVRVPLLVKLPHSRLGGRVVDDQVRLIDVMPTVLDVLGIPAGEDLQGSSLLPLLDERGPDAPEVLGTQAISEIAEDMSDPCVSIRTEGLKYLYFPKDDRGELYDLQADPDEHHDVALERPEKAAELREEARQIYSEGQERDVAEVSLDQETIDELRALGYVK